MDLLLSRANCIANIINFFVLQLDGMHVDVVLAERRYITRPFTTRNFDKRVSDTDDKYPRDYLLQPTVYEYLSTFQHCIQKSTSSELLAGFLHKCFRQWKIEVPHYSSSQVVEKISDIILNNVVKLSTHTNVQFITDIQHSVICLLFNFYISITPIISQKKSFNFFLKTFNSVVNSL